MMQMKLENKTDITLHGVKPGETIVVKTDKYGVPKDKRWRDRLRDAEIDGAFSVVTDTKTGMKAVTGDK